MRKRNIKKQIWIDAKEDELLKRKSKEDFQDEVELWYSEQGARLIRDNYYPLTDGYYIYIISNGVGFFADKVYTDIAEACRDFKDIWETIKL